MTRAARGPTLSASTQPEDCRGPRGRRDAPARLDHEVSLQNCSFADNSAASLLLESDYTIASGDFWTLLGPMTVGATKTVSADLELTVEGRLLARGTAADPITFRSAETVPAAGDWAGIQFVDKADMGLSELEYCSFEYATHAVALDSLSGDIFNCSFSESELADIYLDRDTRIPKGYEWDLVGPTDVVMNTADAGSTGSEDNQRIEIDVYGKLRTTAAGTDSVFFGSNAPVPSAGDWYGITFRATDPDTVTVAEIRGASIAFCVNPLHFEGADSVLVQDSSIHTFQGTGLDFFYADGAIINNTIEGSKGAVFLSDGAMVGLHTDRSVVTVRDNTIGWHRDYGAKIEFPKSYCGALDSTDVDSLFVETNTITGNGESGTPFTEGTAFAAVWPCEERPLRLFDNTIKYWPEGGIRLTAPGAVQMECNLIQESFSGLDYFRGSQWSSQKVALRRNQLLKNARENLRVEEINYITLFQNEGSGGFAGENTFQPDSLVADEPQPNITSNAPDSTGPLNARKSLWLDVSGNVMPEADSVSVCALIAGTGDSTAVKLRTFLFGPRECSDPEAQAVLQEESLEGGARSAGAGVDPASAALPSDWDLIVRRGSASTQVQLAVPFHGGGPVAVNVYNIQGRRVATLLDREVPPRWREIRWTHSDVSGRRVASGVYFVRLEAGDTAITRKTIVLN